MDTPGTSCRICFLSQPHSKKLLIIAPPSAVTVFNIHRLTYFSFFKQSIMNTSHPYSDHVGSNSVVLELLVDRKYEPLRTAIEFAESGEELWQLYHDCCNEDLERTIDFLNRIETRKIPHADVRAALKNRKLEELLKDKHSTTIGRRTHPRGQLAPRRTASSWSKHQRYWPFRHSTRKTLREIMRKFVG